MTQKRISMVVAVALVLAFVGATTAAAQTGVLFVKNNSVGIKTGASNPGAPLHVVTSGTPVANPHPAISLILQNNSASNNPSFFSLIAGNASNSQMAFGDTDNPFAGQLVYQHNGDVFRWRIQQTDVMRLSPAGLITFTGGTCSPGPCDGTFAPEYEVESIEEHAAYMWENQHLWGVGPTPDDGPINLTKISTGMLHELEKAHIYIEQLHNQLKDMQAELAELKATVASE